jgi:hypothetical protein
MLAEVSHALRKDRPSIRLFYLNQASIASELAGQPLAKSSYGWEDLCYSQGRIASLHVGSTSTVCRGIRLGHALSVSMRKREKFRVFLVLCSSKL